MEKVKREELMAKYRQRCSAHNEDAERFPEPPSLEKVLLDGVSFMETSYYPLNEQGYGWYPAREYRRSVDGQCWCEIIKVW